MQRLTDAEPVLPTAIVQDPQRRRLETEVGLAAGG